MSKTIKTILTFAMEDTYKSQNRNIPMLGIAYLQSAIQSAGFYCKRIDPFADNFTFRKNDFIDEVIKDKFDVVGFSILECNFKLSLELASAIKKLNPSVKILFGGIYATILNERLLNYDCIDVVLRGEGENAIVELITDLQENNKFTKEIIGCSYRSLNGKKIITEHVNYLQDLDNNVYPNRDDYKQYSSMEIDGVKKSLIPISSSRGCPFACAFCSVSMISSRWRARSVDDVINEINEIYKRDRNIVITFIDDNFFVLPNRSLQIMNFLKSINVKFIFATRVDQLIRAKDKLQEIKDCGCISIELGIENGSNPMLKRFNKKTSVQDNIEALKLCYANNLTPSVDFITFDDKTSVEELKENIDFFKESGLWGYYPIFFYNRVYPYEGTKYFDIIKDNDKYFLKNNIDLIYDKLMMFGTDYQPTLDKLYSVLFYKSCKSVQEKLDFVYVKTLPYTVFEKLVNSLGEFNIHEFKGKIKVLKERYLKEN